jgi:general secretion pathway protein H
MRRVAAHGFTLIEILVVTAIVALAAGLIAVAVRDPSLSRLEQEAARLAVILESARAEARASGLAVRWIPGNGGDTGAPARDFRFEGLPRQLELPQRWLHAEVGAEVVGASAVVLGPEPMIGAQRIVLRLNDRRVSIGTDGLKPFEQVTAEAAPTP